MRCGLCFSEEDALHAPPPLGGRERAHVERPERTRVIWEGLSKAGLTLRCTRVPIRPLTRSEALLCHTLPHLEALDALEAEPPAHRGAWVGEEGGGRITRRGWTLGGGDMYHTPHTPHAARLAAGGVLALTQRVCEGSLAAAVAVVRPPGHHACGEGMCGFCFLNSAAIAARFAVRCCGAERVLLLDWDVHHGNGTQKIFEADPSVLYISLHKLAHGFFPGSGEAVEVASPCVALAASHQFVGRASQNALSREHADPSHVIAPRASLREQSTRVTASRTTMSFPFLPHRSFGAPS